MAGVATPRGGRQVLSGALAALQRQRGTAQGNSRRGRAGRQATAESWKRGCASMTPPARSALFILLLFLAAAPATVHAHETRPAYIEVTEQPPAPQPQSQQEAQQHSQIWSVLWKSPTLGDPPIFLHPVLGDAALENLPG